MRKWLIKLLAGKHVVFVNADLWSGDRAAGKNPDLRIVLGRNQQIITINSSFNAGRLDRAATYISRIRASFT